jgi:hypothetical protein
MADGWASSSWTAVDARILEDGRMGSDGSQALSYTFTTAEGTQYRNTRFSFAYDERATRIDLFVRDNSRSVAMPDGSTSRVVTVYYDPSNPSRSCMQPGVARDIWFPILLSTPLFYGCFRTLRFASIRFPRPPVQPR